MASEDLKIEPKGFNVSHNSRNVTPYTVGTKIVNMRCQGLSGRRTWDQGIGSFVWWA